MPSIELYGQARILAGVRELQVEGTTLGEALRALAKRFPSLVGKVVEADGTLTPAYIANLNGARFLRFSDEPLSSTDQVLVISSLSGG